MLKPGLIAGALCLAGMAAAGETGVLPELRGVTQVPPGDTLNVRAGPSGAAQDIGDLLNGDQIEILEVRGNWARILWQEANGWISLKYTKPVPRPALASGLPVALGCSGTEPFWSLNLLKIGVAMNSGDNYNGSYLIQQSGVSQNDTPTYYFSGEGLTGVLRREICSDGMSDRDYGWRLDLVGPQGLQSGCCSMR